MITKDMSHKATNEPGLSGQEIIRTKRFGSDPALVRVGEAHGVVLDETSVNDRVPVQLYTGRVVHLLETEFTRLAVSP